MPDLGRAVHAGLRLQEVARRPSLDEVARDRERAAGEADDGLLVVQLLADEADRLEHEGDCVLRIRHTEPLDVGEARDRLAHDRPDAVDELDVDAHPDGPAA